MTTAFNSRKTNNVITYRGGYKENPNLARDSIGSSPTKHSYEFNKRHESPSEARPKVARKV
jgi:hypothetical protein